MSNQLIKEVSRGQRAKEILNDELFIETFEQLEAQYIQTWIDAPLRDVEGQHKLKLMVNILRQVKSNIADIMKTGNLAKIQIEEIEEKKKRQRKNK